MVSLRDQFVSKSQAKRVAVQQQPRTPKCVYFSTLHGMPYNSNKEACNNPAEGAGRHGFLCKQHGAQQEAILESMRKNANNHRGPAPYVDPDVLITDQILRIEARAIGRGQQIWKRFGSCAPGFKPDYVKYLEKE